MESTGTIGGGSHRSNSGSHHGGHGHNHHNHHHHNHHNHQPPVVIINPHPHPPPRQVIVSPPLHQHQPVFHNPPVIIVDPQQPHRSRTIIVEQRPQRPKGSLSCWQFCIILIAFLYFVVTVPLPFSETLEVMHGDRKLLHFEGNWFHAVSIDGLHSNIDAFLFDTKPRTDEVVALPMRTIQPVLQEGGFHAIRYDLYPESEVYVEWKFEASRFGPSVLFLRGQEAFDLFKRGDLQEVPSVDKLHEKYHSLEGDFLLRANKRAEYYFVFYMAEPGTSAGKANFHVTARTVNLLNPPPVSSSVRSCPDKSKRCSLDLTSNGGYSHLDDYYLALVTPVTSEYGDIFPVRIGKAPRVMKYVGAVFRSVLFVIVFGGFIVSLFEGVKGVALILLGIVLCGCRRARERATGYQAVNVTDEEADIGGRGPLLDGGSPAEAPPAYTISSDTSISETNNSKIWSNNGTAADSSASSSGTH